MLKPGNRFVSRRMALSSSRVAHNNFDSLRLVLAATVAVYHLAVLTQRPEFAWLRSPLLADFAVKAFFVISGFLVTQSLRNTRTLTDYLAKRLRRLLPGYVAVVLASVVLGAAITSWPLEAFVGDAQTWRYLFWNLLFLTYKAMSLPGVFDSGANVVSAVNGSLWTIKVEVGFYVALPLILWFTRRLGIWPVVTALYLAGVAWRHGMYDLAETNGPRFAGLATHLPGQLAYFACGIAGQMVRPSARALAVAGAAAGGVMLLGPVGHALGEPLLYAALVLGFAVHMPYLGAGSRYGDFSYGLYLVHFPVLQAMVEWGGVRARPVGRGLDVRGGCGLAGVAVVALRRTAISAPFVARRAGSSGALCYFR